MVVPFTTNDSNLSLFLLQAALCKYGFATNEPSTMPDGTVIPYTFLPDMRVRSNHMDESHHPLDNSHDEGGTRATTYVDNSLNRSGSRTTRSGPHVTGCYSVNLSGQVNPPLFIYTSKAKDPQVNASWVETLGKTRGKWGHACHVLLPSMVAARKEGSMDGPLFRQFILTVSCALFDLLSNSF